MEAESGQAWFGVLGPIQVRAGDAEVSVRGAKQRILLAVLILNAGRVVPVSKLADALWGEHPPPSADTAVRNYVMRLRRDLGALSARIDTRAPGYLISIGADELDLSRFEALLKSAGVAAEAGRWEAASRDAAAALELWRGDPLCDAGSDALARQEVPRLEELRLRAVETRIEADLHLGRHGEVAAELEHLIAANPLRENLYAQLMLALSRSGRQADALAVYQRARDAVIDALGIEPGDALRKMHQRILSGESAESGPSVPVPGRQPEETTVPVPVVPRQLPRTVRGFVGREAELAALSEFLNRTEEPSAGLALISAIGGTAGVGKTALAVQWAHHVKARFPDGQLYVNLRGYDPGQPVSAADALAGFLRALGMAGERIPADTDERAAAFRSLLDGRRVLIVLDNAREADQVRPLLPGSSACLVVVTSRDAMAGLAARDGAERIALGLLPAEEAARLLRELIGERASADPDAVARIAGCCGRLPLALRVAAELANSRPGVPLADLAAELADRQRRLDLLDADGDIHTAVREVFSWSCRNLDAATARVFRLAGLHPGPDFDVSAAAALAGLSVADARASLDRLAQAHLVQPAEPGRYGLHDLLRGYARECAADQEGDGQCRAALTRLFDYYLQASAAAMDTLSPDDRRDWLDRERDCLVAVAGYAAGHGWPGHTVQLAATVTGHLHNSGHLGQARAIDDDALGAARRTGDRPAEAAVLLRIGDHDWRHNRDQQAADSYRQALALSRAAGDRAGEALALSSLALAEKDLGHQELAARCQQEALAIFRDLGDLTGEARGLSNLGQIRHQQGRYDEAAGHYQQVLALARSGALDDPAVEAMALNRLGGACRLQGRYQDAVGYYLQSLAQFRDIGRRLGEGETLARLGETHVHLGRYEEATRYYEETLAMGRELGLPTLEAEARYGLGTVLFQTGDTAGAREHYSAVLGFESGGAAQWQLARAHSGLARVFERDGDAVQARHHWQEALTRYDAIGAPEAREIRARLAAAAPSPASVFPGLRS